MTIIHIYHSLGRAFAGADVVIPEHIMEQQHIERVGCVNITNIQNLKIENQFEYYKGLKLSSLPAPFNNPDIIIFHQIYYPKFLDIARQACKANIPYIIIPHGSLTIEAQKMKRFKKLIGNLLLFNHFISHACAIQCLSQRELETTHFGKEKFIGTNGITLPIKQKVSFSTDGIRFLYIGRLDAYHKGLDLLLESVHQCADELRQAHCNLDIYGPDYHGQYATVERLISERSIGDIVKLHPAVSGEEKERILLDADVFIQTSRFEGMPMGILEAMSYGLPCLVTKGTTLGEINDRYAAGWTAETDVESIVQKLKQAIRERDRLAVLSQNARRLIEENFEWGRVSSETIEKYRYFINKH